MVIINRKTWKLKEIFPMWKYFSLFYLCTEKCFFLLGIIKDMITTYINLLPYFGYERYFCMIKFFVSYLLVTREVYFYELVFWEKFREKVIE